MKRVFISYTKCYLSIYAVPDNVLSARNKSQGKYNPVFKDFIGEEGMDAIMECFLDSVMVSFFKVKALDYLLLSQKSLEANQLRELERAA